MYRKIPPPPPLTPKHRRIWQGKEVLKEKGRKVGQLQGQWIGSIWKKCVGLGKRNVSGRPFSISVFLVRGLGSF